MTPSATDAANSDPSRPLPHEATVMAKNLANAAEQCQLIMHEFLTRQAANGNRLPFDPLNIAGAFTEMFARMLANPARLMERQVELWQDYLQLWQHAASRMLGAETEAVVEPDARDKRFKDPAWQENTVFDFLKQSYLLASRWVQGTVAEVEGMDTKTARKIDFYTRQFVDALSPSNFLVTNPEVLRATLESNGENLVRGLRNMLEDIERGQGSLRISMTDESAFALGRNLAMTPGKVIFRNDLMELIQYAPATDTVYQKPILMIPAWINKYYILDLTEDNSIVRWLVGQGYTVFVISWVNPDERLGRKRFDDYMLEGPVAALDAIKASTGEESVLAVGYCLGGTLLSITQSYLRSKKQAHRVAAAIYLTTMIDFTEAGELSVFIDEEQLRAMEQRMSEKGYLEGSGMAMTFNMLRANDLIWSFVVNNYLLGKDPFPFDLLYWNSDSTRMPAAMHSFYLRNMYQNNLLVQPGGITLDGTPIDITKNNTPSLIVSAREDHIAPWKSTYAATQLYKGDTTFLLAASGHIAGMVNPPGRKKYSYWTNEKLPEDPDAWFKGAKETPGSWWLEWDKWMQRYAGEKVPARKPGDGKLKPLCDAPGEYVKVV